MATFLYYNPNANTSRYSRKARFSKRQSILLDKGQSALNSDHERKVNRGPASSICPAQSNIRNVYDLQPAGPGMLLKNLGLGNSVNAGCYSPFNSYP
jgi:hypothetical protein